MSRWRDELEENKYLFDKEDSIIDQRFKICLKWYIHKACGYKMLFCIHTLISGSCPLITVAVTNVMADNNMTISKIIVSALSVIAGVSVVTVNMLRPKEKWTKYRTTAEFLKRARAQYLLTSEQTEDENEKRKLRQKFLEEIEALMEEENREWEKRNICDKDQKDNP